MVKFGLGNESFMKFISFDLDGTLVTPDFHIAVWDEAIPRLYAWRKDTPFEQAVVEVRRIYDEVGERRVEWYDIKYWLRRFDLGISWWELFAQVEDRIRAYDEVPEVLERLSRRYRLILCTNATREFTETELRVLNLDRFFSGIFSATSDFYLVKKKPEFYLLVCRRLGVEPGEIVHVGDHPEFDFEVPWGLGIRAYLLDRACTKTGQFIVHDLRQISGKLDRL
jgi:HAD superfamily hydrolase (TIGR01549 family)